jgi:hypothetical protein
VLQYARAQSKRIVVRDDGGIYTKAYSAVYYKPFTEKTGIEVVGVQANAEPVAQIRSMVETRNYTWDMAKISQPAILLLTQGGKVYLEKHGLEGDDHSGAFHVALRRGHQRLQYGPGLSHRRLQGPQGTVVVGRLLERQGFPRPPRPAQAPVRHAGRVADGRRHGDLRALSAQYRPGHRQPGEDQGQR